MKGEDMNAATITEINGCEITITLSHIVSLIKYKEATLERFGVFALDTLLDGYYTSYDLDENNFGILKRAMLFY